MRIVSIALILTLSGCAGQIQWGVPTEQKIAQQMQPVMEALQQHAQAINNQAKAIEALHQDSGVQISEQASNDSEG